MTPPAGPHSTRRTGKRRAVSTVQMPPDDIISSSGQVIPRPARPSRMRAEVAGHQRQDVGVGDGGRGALVFADFAADLGGEGDRQVGQRGGDDVAGAFLVRGVDVGVEEADRQRLDVLRFQDGDQGAQGWLRRAAAGWSRRRPGVRALPGAGRAPPAGRAVPCRGRTARSGARRRFPGSRGSRRW